MKNGTMPDSLSTRVAQSQKQNDMTDIEVAYTLASSFGAGFETVLSFFCTDNCNKLLTVPKDIG